MWKAVPAYGIYTSEKISRFAVIRTAMPYDRPCFSAVTVRLNILVVKLKKEVIEVFRVVRTYNLSASFRIVAY